MFYYCSAHHPALHSFPTRRSSDLFRPVFGEGVREGCPCCHVLHAAGHRGDGRRAGQVRHVGGGPPECRPGLVLEDRKSTRLNSSHMSISYAVFCLKKKNKHYV